MLRESEPLAIEVTVAIRNGDDAALRRLLADNPGLARESVQAPRRGSRTLLHVVTDWPGCFPNGPAIVAALIEAGADPNARAADGGAAETPLHRAASTEDTDVAAALIDGGADLEAPDGSIGTPLDNAIGYGCWTVARLLVGRGARVDKLWHAAALGMYDRLIDLLAQASVSDGALSEAFLLACGGGQRRTTEVLLARGARGDWLRAHEAEPKHPG